MQDKILVQYGAGWCAPEGWRNYDASPTLRFERIPLVGRVYKKNRTKFPRNVKYGDIVKGLPIPDNSCAIAYSSHVLEHLSLNDFRCALRNTFKILQVNGVFRLVMPDLEYLIHEYLNDLSAEAAIKFMYSTGLGKKRRMRTLKDYIIDYLGNSTHLWMWDYKAIKGELQDIGFKKIRRAKFGDSDYSEFREVELYKRWENCLGLECIK